MCRARLQLKAIEAALRKVPRKELGECVKGEKRAVVACILRRSMERPDTLDMLFILRAGQRESRWSGQVGFPGGHVEEGESDLEALERECREEVGLAVRAPAYRHLGEARARSFSVGDDGQRLVVLCHVFEQMSHQQPQDLQEAEVAACGWAPLSALTGDEAVHPLAWSRVTGEESSWDGYPSVRLPICDEDMFLANSTELHKGALRELFNLWGLTLSIVNELMTESNLRVEAIDGALLQKLKELSPSRFKRLTPNSTGSILIHHSSL